MGKEVLVSKSRTHFSFVALIVIVLVFGLTDGSWDIKGYLGTVRPGNRAEILD